MLEAMHQKTWNQNQKFWHVYYHHICENQTSNLKKNKEGSFGECVHVFMDKTVGVIKKWNKGKVFENLKF